MFLLIILNNFINNLFLTRSSDRTSVLVKGYAYKYQQAPTNTNTIGIYNAPISLSKKPESEVQ